MRYLLSRCFRKYQLKLFESEINLSHYYFQYWMDHSNILELLIQINRHDIIYARHLKNAQILLEKFDVIPWLHIKHGNHFIAIHIRFTISILTAWFKSVKNCWKNWQKLWKTACLFIKDYFRHIIFKNISQSENFNHSRNRKKLKKKK